MIADTMMVSKGITLLTQMAMFNEDTIEWRRQSTDQKTWAKFKIFFHQDRFEQRKVVQKIYGVTPTPTEYHHEAIDHINTIVQGIQTQRYDLEEMEQTNEALTSSKKLVMAKLAHITVTMNAMQVQPKTLAEVTMDQTRSNSNYYCWSCRSNYNQGSKT